MNRSEILCSISVSKAEYGFLTLSMTGKVNSHVIRPMVQQNVTRAKNVRHLKKIKGELEAGQHSGAGLEDTMSNDTSLY